MGPCSHFVLISEVYNNCWIIIIIMSFLERLSLSQRVLYLRYYHVEFNSLRISWPNSIAEGNNSNLKVRIESSALRMVVLFLNMYNIVCMYVVLSPPLIRCDCARDIVHKMFVFVVTDSEEPKECIKCHGYFSWLQSTNWREAHCRKWWWRFMAKRHDQSIYC